MRIKFITEEGLLAAKANYAVIYKEILKKKTMDLPTLFNDSSIIRDSSIEIEEFSFDMSQDKPVATDVENIRRVYNHMKGLSEYRWMPDNENDKLDRYFFSKPKHGYSKRPLFRNGIARLWWIGYHTYDSKRTNPYELTEFICRDQDYINNLLDIGFASNAAITRAIISALLDAEKNGITVNRDLVRTISQYVNMLGGIYILDCLSYEEIYSKIKEKIDF